MSSRFAGGVFDDSARRKQLAESRYNGIDYLEVDTTPGQDNQRLLRVFFIPPAASADPNKVTRMLADLDGNRDAFIIEGGSRVRQVIVLEAKRVFAHQQVADHMAIRVDRPGDFTDYSLRIIYTGSGIAGDDFPLDRFYSQISFNFKAGCPTRFDCHQTLTAPPEPPADLFIDYLAKDYDSFRQAMIDLLPKLIPDWSERRAADLGMTLLELLAYTADQLSYYQDAVANEAYLETARQRISVRRHARLIDYAMHDGLSARTLVQLELSAGALDLAASDDEDRIIQLMTPPQGLNLPTLIPPERGEEALAASATPFEIHLRRADPASSRPAESLHFHALLNGPALHDWGNQIAFLPIGATSADLQGDLIYQPEDPGKAEPWRLKAQDLLLFEELIDPDTGQELLADPNHRHLVRITKVEQLEDPLHGQGQGQALTRVHWDEADALPFCLWISNVTEDGSQLTGISVARGNLALADCGRSFDEWHPRAPETGAVGLRPGSRALQIPLRQSPLAYSIPLASLAAQPANDLYQVDPRQGKPAVHRIESTLDIDGTPRQHRWQVVTPSLLASDRFAEDVTVETDNTGRAQLRFGDNQFGAVPDGNSFFQIHYRTGIGPEGNIGADKLTHLIGHDDIGAMINIQRLRNPLPAWGGASPESMAEVKRLAPAAFRAALKRAVTEDDHARVAELHPRVARAIATFRWTGSWHTVFVQVDPKGTSGVDEDLRQSLVAWISRYTMTGYDIEIIEPSYISLSITLEICVEPGYFSADLAQILKQTLGNTTGPDGQPGFFHPDNFTFGQRFYLSTLYAAVEQVAGVQSVTIGAIHRQDSREPEQETRDNLAQGFIEVGENGVIRLDNAPAFPENGILQLNLQGGVR